MKRRSKVELFERIRRAYELEKKSIRAIARQYGVHRRMVRQAIANAIPPDRKTPQRPQPQMDEVKEFIKQILEKDKKEPRKIGDDTYVQMDTDRNAAFGAIGPFLFFCSIQPQINYKRAK